jgi:hypothetical protein
MRHAADRRFSVARGLDAGTGFLFGGLELRERTLSNIGYAIRVVDSKAHLLQEIAA